MTKAFRDVIALLVSAARGGKSETDGEIDLKQIYKIAQEQNVLPTIYPALMQMNFESEYAEIFSNIEKSSLRLYSFQYSRREFLKELYEQLNKNNICFCVLKGDVLAQFYSEPLLRVASDVDIRVDKGDADRCMNILKENGYEIGALTAGEHHYECRHKKYGLLELHIAFCLDKTNEICFGGEMDFNEPYQCVDIPGLGKVNILGYTDGYIYLVMHFIKHFISSGAGIRHLMDIALYVENYYEYIDMKRAEAVFNEIGYTAFVRNIMFICRKFLLSDICGKYSADDDNIDEKVDMILSDMETGGVFGHYDNSRIDFYDVYLERRAERNRLQNKSYKKSICQRIFKPMTEMKSLYTYLDGRPYLYPVAFVNRIIAHIKYKKRKHSAKPKNQRQYFDERLSMLYKVGLL